MSQQPRKSPSVRGLRSRARILVTGGAGFIGSNLASRLASEGFDVLVLDALLRPGVERNMRWLKSRHPERITPITADIRDASTADVIRDADSIFHFAAQVAVTDSLKRPLDDFAINLRGSMDLLEAARRSPRKPALIFASTNKVYGDLADIELEATGEAYAPRHQDTKTFGISEQRSLSFHTPY